MSTIIAAALLLIGSAFLLLASLGIFRMPDLYMRMSSSSKGVTLGAGCLALGFAFYMNDVSVTTRALLVVLLFFLKAPVAAHMLGRAAYRARVPLWEGTLADELREHEHPGEEPGTAPEAETNPPVIPRPGGSGPST